MGNSHLEQIAYNKIRELILNGDIKSGEKIVQDQLAEQIGVSRTPLRQAIINLERDFLLEITGQGIFVREINSDFIHSVWEVRAVLEGLACRICADKMDSPTIAYLRALFDDAYLRWGENGEDKYFEADMIFHSKLVEIANNPILEKSFNTTHVFSVQFKIGLLRSPEITHQEHASILDALEARDGELAEQLMVNHIRNGAAYIKNNALHSKQ